MSKRTVELKKDKEFISLLGKITDKELSEKYVLSINIVRKLRKECGIPAKRVHKFPEGIENYAGKMTDKDAANRLGCHATRVFTYRLENKIEPCKKAEVFKNTEQIVKDYEEFGTLQKVADKYGCTREWVRQILKRAGYTKRFYNFSERK